MESYLPLLLHFSQEVELTTWVPQVLAEHVHLPFKSNQLLEHPDIHIINQSDETLKIEAVRQLQELSTFSPYQLAQSIFVLQKVDTASIAAQNALLKILEEPAAGNVILLTTFNPTKVLPTIHSRSQMIVWDSPPLALPPQIERLYETLMNSSHGDLTLLSETFSDRPQSLKVVSELTYYVHSQLQKDPYSELAKTYIQQLKTLLEAASWLEKNANVKLVLTECFFKLHDKQPILRA